MKKKLNTAITRRIIISFQIQNGLPWIDKESGPGCLAQRYWVERTFDDSKNELGMSDYYKKRLEQMNIRHLKRQRDIDRYYRKVDKWEDI